jgi:prolyl-tRNA editing enzyme YbaK/EbsC (Cys-tRNA(Pro) deacylase)
MAVSQFRQFVQDNNLDIEIIESEEQTHTAQAAADVHGVPVSNIVKSLLVKTENGFEIFLTPGDRRLELPDNSRMANADEVKEITGYSIGGVPPFGHSSKLVSHIVDGFDEKSDIVAAAGSANSVFRTTLESLRKIVS